MPTRRQLLVSGYRLAALAVLAGCGPGWAFPARGRAAVLGARPRAEGPPPPAPGTHRLGLTRHRDPVLHVPPTLPAGRPPALVLALHGAGGDAAAGVGLLQPFADEGGLLVLAPASRGRTWDAVGGDFGADATLIDRALQDVFGSVAVDPARVGVAGFSDGGSYALGLGLANGGLFAHVVAFSPGFVPTAPRHGRPPVLVSHGEDDGVLPFAETSGLIVPELREDGYDVTFRRFAGGHEVPRGVVREAVGRLT